MRSQNPHDAIVQSSSEPPYAGKAGQTRTERHHLVAANGALRTIELYRVVNTASHPDLKALVLAGQLHRLDDGRELAIPFVYHDPQNRKLALVIPGVLAHLEMKEWARLMAEIAEDTDHGVPAYVRDATTVVGLGALEMFLEAGVEPEDEELSELPGMPSDAAQIIEDHQRALEARERLLMEREREVSDQEQSLIRLAGDLTGRESALLRREEQLTTARADLEVREADLTTHSVQPGPTHDADVVPDGEWQEVRAGDLGAAPAARRAAPTTPLPIVEEPTVVAALARVAASGVYAEPGLSTPMSSEPPPLPHRGAPPPLRARPASRSTAPPPLRVPSGAAREPNAPAREPSGPLRVPSSPLTRSAGATPPGNARSSRSQNPEAETRVAPPASAPSPAAVTTIAQTSIGALPLQHVASDPELQKLQLDALHALLKDGGRRLPALLEIGRRRDPSSVNMVFSALDAMPPEHVVHAVACLATFAERSVEALIAGLGSPNASVRQACAIALGKLKLRRGLAPLLEQLEAEPTPAWQELARALGDFGMAALRALSRGIHNSARRERLMVALSHLANHGCASDLENMERDPDAVLALAARQALARRSRLQWEDQAVRKGGTLRDPSPEARLSQALYGLLSTDSEEG
jgi:hypothetical protein